MMKKKLVTTSSGGQKSKKPLFLINLYQYLIINSKTTLDNFHITSNTLQMIFIWFLVDHDVLVTPCAFVFWDIRFPSLILRTASLKLRTFSLKLRTASLKLRTGPDLLQVDRKNIKHIFCIK